MDEFLTAIELRELNKQQVSRSLANLENRGYFKYPTGQGNPQITEEGLRRLRSLFPSYDEKRLWDGKLYLITYDVPESKRRTRNVLREALKKIGCGKLQDSVWVTPYDPRRTLQDLVFTRKIAGYVVISEVGENGMIGGESFQTLARKIYPIDRLDQEYGSFIKKYRRKTLDPALAWDFLAILQDDPQLPFSLLPKDWSGKEAYEIFKESKPGRKLLTLKEDGRLPQE